MSEPTKPESPAAIAGWNIKPLPSGAVLLKETSFTHLGGVLAPLAMAAFCLKMSGVGSHGAPDPSGGTFVIFTLPLLFLCGVLVLVSVYYGVLSETWEVSPNQIKRRRRWLGIKIDNVYTDGTLRVTGYYSKDGLVLVNEGFRVFRTLVARR